MTFSDSINLLEQLTELKKKNNRTKPILFTRLLVYYKKLLHE